MKRQPLYTWEALPDVVATEAPTPNCVGLICKLLGFKGDYRSWLIRPHPETAAVSIVEPLEAT